MPPRKWTAVWRNIACGAALFLSLPVVASELPFRHFTTENQISPLPSASVQQVMQDRLGFIWFAFYSSGIARYDGHSMELYGMNDGLPDLTAREIVEDRHGYLWVGTETGLVVSDKPLQAYSAGERLRFVKEVYGTKLVQRRIRRNWVTANPDGSLWVGTSGDGIIRYWRRSDGALHAQQIFSGGEESSLRNEPVNSILALRDGTVLAAVGSGTLLHLSTRGDRIGRYGTELGVPPDAVTTMVEGKGGRVWLGSMSGALHVAPRPGQAFELVSDELSSRIFSILEQDDGTVWAASLGSGVLRFPEQHPEQAVRLDRRNGLLSDSLWGILSDREGNLWFAQNGGVSRLKRDWRAFESYTSVSHFGEKPSLPDPSAFTVRAEGSTAGALGQYVWVGTGSGLVAMKDGVPVATLDSSHGLLGNSIYSLGGDGEGRLWIGTVDGLSVITPPDAAPPVAGGDARDLELFGSKYRLMSWRRGPTYSCGSFERPDTPLKRSAWFAGSNGVWALIGGEWFHFERASGLPATGATGVEIDDQGVVWIATADAGLQRSHVPVSPEVLAAHSVLTPGGKIGRHLFERVWDQQRGAPTSSVRALIWNEGRLWATTGRGVYVFQTEPFRVVHVIDSYAGSPLENVSSLALSRDRSSVWVTHNRGLLEIATSRAAAVREVSKEHGVLDNEAWAYSALAAGRDGSVYFATPKGLTIYHPLLDGRNSTAPVVRLRRFELRESRVGTNELEIEFAALTFGNEGMVRYRTRLLGYDDEWSKPTREYKIRYTNLPAALWPRRYELQVVAMNEDGVWTQDPFSLGVSIAPPWWLRWWAVLAYVALFALSLVLFNRYRTRKLERLNRDLERAIASRTDQILVQTRELETLDRIVQLINREVSLEKLLETLLQQGLVLFPQAEKAAFLVFDPQQQRCEVAAVSGYDPELFRGLSFSLEEAIRRYCEGAELLGEGVYLIRELTHLAGREKTLHLPQPKSMLAMEVALGGLLEGFLIFDNFTDRDAFHHSDLRKLSRFREHAISAITKTRTLRELETKNREAEQANRAKSAFLANMSHELRTPLNSIIGFSEILVERMEKEMAPRYMNFLKLILTSGQHLLSIINDVLDLSKIEAGRMEVFPERFHIRPVVEGVCTVMKGLSSKKGITFDIDVPMDLPPIESDPGKFKQILYNLLSNAVKFSPSGSTVAIKARDGRSTMGVPVMSVSVRDEGIGIAPEHQPVIFDEFRQLDSTVTRRYEGTGLGLSLVKKFVDLQSGTLELVSELGKGSTFTFTLPLQAVRGGGDGRSDLVVVVTQEDRVYEALARSTDAAALKSMRARSAEDAVRMFSEMQVGMAMLHLSPLVAETTMIDALRSIGREKGIPLVLCVTDLRGDVISVMPVDGIATKSASAAELREFLDALPAVAAHGSARMVILSSDERLQQIVREREEWSVVDDARELAAALPDAGAVLIDVETTGSVLAAETLRRDRRAAAISVACILPAADDAAAWGRVERGATDVSVPRSSGGIGALLEEIRIRNASLTVRDQATA